MARHNRPKGGPTPTRKAAREYRLTRRATAEAQRAAAVAAAAVPAPELPAWQPPAGRLRKAELIAAIRAYASQPETRCSWTSHAEAWDDEELWGCVKGAATFTAARSRVEAAIAPSQETGKATF